MDHHIWGSGWFFVLKLQRHSVANHEQPVSWIILNQEHTMYWETARGNMSSQLITGGVVHFCDSAMRLLLLQPCTNTVGNYIWPLKLGRHQTFRIALRQTTLKLLAHFQPERHDRFQNQTNRIVEAWSLLRTLEDICIINTCLIKSLMCLHIRRY